MRVLEDDEREAERDERRRNVRRQFFHALFYLGTLLAVIGWYIELRGAAEYSSFLEHLTIVALIGHALQVIATFMLLLTPDKEVTDEDEDDS